MMKRFLAGAFAWLLLSSVAIAQSFPGQINQGETIGRDASGKGPVQALTPSRLRDMLDLVPGTDVQAFDADLSTLALAFITASASGAASLDFAEDTDNGVNRVRLIGAASTADVSVTLPAATDTLVGKATTDTLTNKTIDANGTGNSITNIETGDIADGTILEADLSVADSPSDEECLTSEGTGFEWQACGSVADADYGDVDVSSSGTVWTVQSINSLTFTPADAGADAILGWDDSAGAYENLTRAEVQAVIGDIALGTETSGNYVATVADGTGIDGTASGEGATYTPSLDLTELNTFTLGAGSATGIIFDAGATDPAIEVASGSLTIDIGGTNEVVASANGLDPGANDGGRLGVLGTAWSDLALADDGVIALGASGSQATITHTAASDSITISADPNNATASSTILFAVDGTTEVVMGAVGLAPNTNDGYQLGVSTLQWSDGFFAEGAVLNFDNGDITITQTGDNLAFAGLSTITINSLVWTYSSGLAQLAYTDAGVSGPILRLYGNSASPAASDQPAIITFAGNDAGGAQTTYGSIISIITDTTDGSEGAWLLLSSMVGGSGVGVILSNNNFGPQTNDTIAVGATNRQWSDVFVAEGGVINFDNGDCTLTQTGNSAAFGGCTLTGASVDAASDTASGVSEIAVQSEQETGTDTTRAVTPGRQQFHPSAAKVWGRVTVSGGTPTLQANYNVTSITDTDTGRLTVTVATDFSAANYAVLCSYGQQDLATGNIVCHTNTTTGLAAGSFELMMDGNEGTNVDPVEWSFVAYGDQ